MCDVPSIAVFCSESIECFLGTISKFFFKLLVAIPAAPISTGTIVYFRFHFVSSLYINSGILTSFPHPLLLLLLLLFIIIIIIIIIQFLSRESCFRIEDPKPGYRAISIIFLIPHMELQMVQYLTENYCRLSRSVPFRR